MCGEKGLLVIPVYDIFCHVYILLQIIGGLIECFLKTIHFQRQNSVKITKHTPARRYRFITLPPSGKRLKLQRSMPDSTGLALR